MAATRPNAHAAGEFAVRLREADQFLRIHYFVFTAFWPLLAATTLGRDFTTGEILTLLAVILCFHVYTYLLNDVIDLPIDRTQPKRQRDLLVRGAIRPSHVLLIALIQPALTVPLTIWLGGAWPAHATLAAGFVFMAAYNLWGKHCPFPPVTDVIQGLAWASLPVYVPLVFGSEPNALTWMVAAFVLVFTMFFNGIHGSLRDLENDLAAGAHTAPILFGARPVPGRSAPYVSATLRAYAWSLLLVLVTINAVVMIRNDFGYGPVVWLATAVAVGALSAFSVVLQPHVVRPVAPVWDRAYRLQLYLVMMSLPFAFFAYASVDVLLTLTVLTFISIPLFDSSSTLLRWVWHAARSAVWPISRRISADPHTR